MRRPDITKFFGAVSDVRSLRKQDSAKFTVANEPIDPEDEIPIITDNIGFLADRIASSVACTFDWPEDDRSVLTQLKELRGQAELDESNLVLIAAIALLEEIKVNGPVEVSEGAYGHVEETMSELTPKVHIPDIFVGACILVSEVLDKPRFYQPNEVDAQENVEIPPVIITS